VRRPSYDWPDWLKVAGFLALIAGLVWLGVVIREYERNRIADRVVEKLREGGGR
jgi:hypothetical protein